MKTKPADPEKLMHDLLAMCIPPDYVNYFDLFQVNNKQECWELILHEKETLIPEELKEREMVLDGFSNPISVLSHCFSLKKVYLIIKRRRWKEAGTDKHYSNEYDLYPDGAKITRDLAAFLKGWDRITSGKHSNHSVSA